MSVMRRNSQTEYATAMRNCMIWHRKVVRLMWIRCAFHGKNGAFHGGRGLEVHHIIPQSKSLRMKYEPTNGILLCPHHHDKAEADAKLFLSALKKAWPATHKAYEDNLAAVLASQMPVRAFELREAAKELKILYHKLTGERS